MLIGPLPPWRSRRPSSGEPSRLPWRRTLTSGLRWRDDEALTLARPTIVVDSGIWRVYPTGRRVGYPPIQINPIVERGVVPLVRPCPPAAPAAPPHAPGHTPPQGPAAFAEWFRSLPLQRSW